MPNFSFRWNSYEMLPVSAIFPSLPSLDFPFSWNYFVMRLRSYTLGFTMLSSSVSVVVSAPTAFPSSGNGLWYTESATEWTTGFLPVGNGYLAAMVPGGIWQETTQLNIEALWAGGSFSNTSYTGGNKLPYQRTSLAQDMQEYRQAIFHSPNGTIPDISELQEDAGAYGSYSGAGYLLTTLDAMGDTSNYARWLDLDNSIIRTTWSHGNSTYHRETFCSHPTQACTEHTNTTSTSLPTTMYAWSVSSQTGLPTANITCFDSSTLQVRGPVAEPGMLYELLFRAQGVGSGVNVTCTPSTGGANPNATLTVEGAKESWVTWVGGTEYSLDAGDEAHGFSFHGPDPHSSLVYLLSSATSTSVSYQSVLAEHIADYSSIISPFSLDLGQMPDLTKSTDQLRMTYRTDVGNPYLEWVLFNFGRYLLVSSARGALPANLQGKWAQDSSNPWSADYHANINLQMNYWMAEITGMNVTQSLWDYMEKTWAPRGSLTAQILYNISEGWVTHDEMNIFGHTGMKNGDSLSAQWADYPESAVWMMIHVWDHFDYTNDAQWWKNQGWLLLKGVASFHLHKLIPDLHFNDSTLVVAPCNSPEQAPITFACSHAQQVIWQLFNAVEKGFNVSGDTDVAFLEAVQSKRAQMDQGVHIGSWGQLQEWKVDLDQQNDTHRHLSHLIGLYPGYAITSYNASLQTSHNAKTSYTRDEVLAAAKVSLIHRGNGTGPDGDAGWEKVWRAAAWAQFADAGMFYHELTYAVERNFGPNLFSLYNPYAPQGPNSVFQIDANLGYPAALLNAFIQAPDVCTMSQPLTVTLLPALPAAWSTGSIRGARVRGGLVIDFAWSGGKLTQASFSAASGSAVSGERLVRVVYEGVVLEEFSADESTTRTIRVHT
ncbi:glycoside hydrolase family 95 protein [Neolentinus lepideus HHB14362 ss-1]|uniref:Glycoside hydrolase family 95 protein n=1 Tax=Neolentinus lepideus HHB14362 ss-1 TaxID=1314782 RepID=A0A165SS52_9AGAM|nr:glycoside hydrolase family 95 protein [Neolentinus lepideus HHB14362 ss-1]